MLRAIAQVQLGAVLGLDEESTAAPRISQYERGDRMRDNESTALLAEAEELPISYFQAVSDTTEQDILVIAQLLKERQMKLVNIIK